MIDKYRNFGTTISTAQSDRKPRVPIHKGGLARSRDLVAASLYSLPDHEVWIAIAARRGDAQRVESPFGTKFSFVSMIVGPNGRAARIISIWVIDRKASVPRFVTAYPKEGR